MNPEEFVTFDGLTSLCVNRRAMKSEPNNGVLYSLMAP
jgi:hypothetical protein